MPPLIRLLPEQLINQIAAGEVIERPASALKELVENAIDAGASRIDITLEEGGLAGLSVADNGHGMSADDMALAVTRHATSKLADDDLLAIAHFGFRGEALPSIASVAVVDITSRTQGEAHGWHLRVAHGTPEAVQPAASDIGTKIEISDLFGSIPARLKFLKTRKPKPRNVWMWSNVWRWPALPLPFTWLIQEKACLIWPHNPIMKQVSKPVLPPLSVPALPERRCQ